MIIVKVWGGLGNQIFIYAMYRGLKERGKEIKLDISSYKYKKAHGDGYLLPIVFENTKQEYAEPKECSKLAIYQCDFFHRVLRKLGINKKTFVSQIYKYGSCGFSPEVLELENAYLEGYFQSEKYFENIKDMLHKELTFRLPEVYPNSYRDSVLATNSVSIHVRRGDYLIYGRKQKLTFETNYYRNAIKYIREQIKKPIFFVFSDDIEWCEKNFAEYEGEYVFVHQKEAYLDMYLMSLCKHNIIADSTFSWWGAWLNLSLIHI